MAFQVHKTCRLCLFDEFGIQLFIAGDKGHIHEGTVFLFHGAMEETALVEIIIKNRRFFLILFLHGSETAVLFQPFEDLAAHVNAVAVGGVVERTRIRVGLVGKHRGRSRKDILSDKVLTDDGDDHAGRADVLLDAAVDNAVFCHIHRFGKETGGHVSHQSLSFRVGKFFEFCSVNRIVFTDVDVIRIRADRKIAAVRDIGKGLILGRGDLVGLSVFLCFLPCLLRPLAGDDIIGHAVLHKVHGDHGELLGRSALQEKHFIVVRNLHQIP